MDNEKRDELLWQIAKRRAGFKWNLAAYFIVNTFLIGVWYFSSGDINHFWPIWPILGWGLGVAFNYFGAYHSNNIFSVEDEYEKLRKQQSQL